VNFFNVAVGLGFANKSPLSYDIESVGKGGICF
jgi:hypothetical protein